MYFENYLASSLVIKHRRNFTNGIKREFQINGYKLKFDELSGWPANGTAPQILNFFWKMVNIWEGDIEHSNHYSP